MSEADLLAFLRPRLAKRWLPADVVPVDEISPTATGEIQKTALRKMSREYRFS